MDIHKQAQTQTSKTAATKYKVVYRNLEFPTCKK